MVTERQHGSVSQVTCVYFDTFHLQESNEYDLKHQLSEKSILMGPVSRISLHLHYHCYRRHYYNYNIINHSNDNDNNDDDISYV